MFAPPSDTAVTILGLKVYYYGIALAFAILMGTIASEWAGRKFMQFQKDVAVEMAPYLVLFGIVGARLYYCMLNFEFYSKFPTEILAIRHGGISIHGAILGGLIGLLIFSYRRKISALKLTDVCAIGLPIAQALGRWGNFFNSEAFGYPTNLPWKLFVPIQNRPIPYQGYEFFHPAFLYESVLDFLIFIVIVLLAKYWTKRKDGNLALIYLILYSLARIFVEHFRIDSVLYIGGISVAIIVSVVIIFMAGLLLVINNIPKKEES